MDEVQEGQPPVAVPLCDGDDQAQVGLDQLVLGLQAVAHLAPGPGELFGVQHVGLGTLPLQGQLVRRQPGGRLVALLNALRDLHLELGAQQGDPADLLEVRVDRVLAAAGLTAGHDAPAVGLVPRFVVQHRSCDPPGARAAE